MTNQPHEQTGLDPAVIEDLRAEHWPYDCSVIEIAPNTWAIHGSIPVDGESILAEFPNKADAEAALALLVAGEAQTGVRASGVHM